MVKIEQFPYPLKVYNESLMYPILQQVIKLYGKDFTNRYNQKNVVNVY